jgi:hypothetical protein
MDWVPGLTWGWLGPSGSLCNEHQTNRANECTEEGWWRQLPTPDLVLVVADKVARASFWSVLADFAASAVVPRRAWSGLLPNQPFLSWSTAVVRGNGLVVVRLRSGDA